MTSLWVTYGLPAVALIFAAVSILYLRHSAQSFDKRYGHKIHPGE